MLLYKKHTQTGNFTNRSLMELNWSRPLANYKETFERIILRFTCVSSRQLIVSPYYWTWCFFLFLCKTRCHPLHSFRYDDKVIPWKVHECYAMLCYASYIFSSPFCFTQWGKVYHANFRTEQICLPFNFSTCKSHRPCGMTCLWFTYSEMLLSKSPIFALENLGNWKISMAPLAPGTTPPPTSLLV